MQPTPIAPSVVLSQSGDRKEVPLRDYLNSRIAPFLKKAMTQSLEAEAEFPLQWLGECLINQSILYEGNTDPTNIKERFRYNFDAPPPVQEQPAESEMNGMEEAAVPEPKVVPTEPTEPPASNEQNMTTGEPAIETEVVQRAQQEKPQADTVAADTEMGGTS